MWEHRHQEWSFTVPVLSTLLPVISPVAYFNFGVISSYDAIVAVIVVILLQWILLLAVRHSRRSRHRPRHCARHAVLPSTERSRRLHQPPRGCNPSHLVILHLLCNTYLYLWFCSSQREVDECRKHQPFVIDVTAHQQGLSGSSGSQTSPRENEGAHETANAMETDQASTSTAQTRDTSVLVKLPNGKCKPLFLFLPSFPQINIIMIIIIRLFFLAAWLKWSGFSSWKNVQAIRPEPKVCPGMYESQLLSFMGCEIYWVKTTRQFYIAM